MTAQHRLAAAGTARAVSAGAAQQGPSSGSSPQAVSHTSALTTSVLPCHGRAVVSSGQRLCCWSLPRMWAATLSGALSHHACTNWDLSPQPTHNYVKNGVHLLWYFLYLRKNETRQWVQKLLARPTAQSYFISWVKKPGSLQTIHTHLLQVWLAEVPWKAKKMVSELRAAMSLGVLLSKIKVGGLFGWIFKLKMCHNFYSSSKSMEWGKKACSLNCHNESPTLLGEKWNYFFSKYIESGDSSQERNI